MDKKSISILLAEDDEDDYLLAMKAMKEARLLNTVYRVRDGQELMDYLLREGQYVGETDTTAPMPYLILLDLNMPRKDGREALKEIKSHPVLKKIPVIILTTSDSEEDIIRSYNLGTNSFIRKPITFEQLVDVMRTIKHYWFDVVRLP